MRRILMIFMLLYITNSYGDTTNIGELKIKKIVHYDKYWHAILYDVLSSENLRFEQLFIDGEISTTIPAGTKSSDHKRVFTLSKTYNPNICHSAYIILSDNNRTIVKKSAEIYFGNTNKCSEKNKTINKKHVPMTYYVALNGNDKNNGKTLKSAFKHIAHALNIVQGGDKILVKGGIYRESNILYKKPNLSNKYITLENYNNDKVVIKGSKVIKKWEHYKNNIWKMSTDKNSKLNRQVHYQQVFYNDGKSLQKIGYPNYLKKDAKNIWKSPYKRYIPIKNNPNNPFGMSEGTFYVKKLTDNTYDLYVWLPNGKKPTDPNIIMEVSDARFILYAYDVDYFKIKGLTFMHSSSSGFGNFSNNFQGGIGLSIGLYGIVENCDISYMDFAGLSLSLGSFGHKAENMHQKIIHSKIHHNGDVGISATTGGFSVLENEFYENGHRPFIQYWHSGAIKTSAGGWGTIADNYIHNERGQGIWFDSCYSNNPIIITRNYLDNIGYRIPNPLDNIPNRGHGLFLEHSSNIFLDHNIINRTQQRGIYLSRSQNAQVVNNLIRASYLEQLGIKYKNDLGLKLTSIRITDNIFLNKVGKFDIKLFYENDKNTTFNRNNLFKNNIIYNTNGLYNGDFSKSHWSFNNNLKDINPLFITHNSKRIDEWQIDKNSPIIQASINKVPLKFDFRRAIIDKKHPKNIGPFENINNSDYNSYIKNHLKLNAY